MAYDPNLGPRAPTLEERLSVPNRWSNLNKTISGFGDMAAQQYQVRQQLQAGLGQQLIQAKIQHLMYPQFSNPQTSQALDQMISQNPYTRGLLGQLGQSLSQQATPSSTMSMGNSSGASSDNTEEDNGDLVNPVSNNTATTGSFNPIMSSAMSSPNGSVITGGNQSLKTPFGTLSQSMQNPIGEKKVAQAKAQGESNVSIPTSYAKDIVGAKAKEDTAYASLNSLSDNLVGNIKAAMIQSGGGGFIPKLAGEIAAGPIGQITGMSGDTSAITAMNATKRDTAVGYARTLAGGSQGVQKLIERILDTIPDQGFTREQAGSSLAEMKMTAMALKSGIDRLKLTSDQLKGMTEDQFDALAKNEISNMAPDQKNEILKSVYQSFANVQPRLQGDIFTGKTFEPKTNKLSKMLGMNMDTSSFGGSQNPVMNAQGTNQSRQLDPNTARGLLQQAGGDKNKAREMAKSQGYVF